MHKTTRFMFGVLSLVALGAVIWLAGGALAADEADWAAGEFAGTPEELAKLVELYQSIELTPEQEAIRRAALDDLPAYCCSNFSAATCCCECNLSRSIWGLSKVLITERQADARTVRRAVEAWAEALNPEGFDGHVCSTGRCNLPLTDGGCGGMNAGHLMH